MILLDKIYKTFHKGTANEFRCINGLTLAVERGDFVTVIGSNGAGKSTMLNILAGAMPVDKGRIEISGKNVTDMPEHKRARLIGRVFQDPMVGTAAALSIEENLALAMKRTGGRGLGPAVRSRYEPRFKEELGQLDLGLENRLKDRIGLLSGGQRQSVTLLMAALIRPHIILLDEHTAALDPKTADTVMRITDKIVRTHKLTAMMITHNMEHALQYGNRLVMLHQGGVFFDARGKERSRLTKQDLLNRFSEVSSQDPSQKSP